MWTPMVAADTTSIANGISEAGRSIGQGMAMRAADMKRREEDDKRKAEQAKKIRGMAKMFQEDLGLSDSEVQGSDADELGGMVEGYMLSQSAKHQKLQQERDALTIAGMKMLQRDSEGRKQIPQQLVQGFQAQERAIPSPWSNEARSEKMTQSTGMPTGVRELIQAHANAGQELPPGIMDDIIRQQGGARNQPFFDPTTANKAQQIEGIPGLSRVVLGPNESQLLNTEPGLKEMRDENGVLIGHQLLNAKGGSQFVRAPISNDLKPADKLRALSSQLTALLSIPTPENKAQAAQVQREINAMLKGTSATDDNLTTDEAPKPAGKVRVPRAWNPKTQTLDPVKNAGGN